MHYCYDSLEFFSLECSSVSCDFITFIYTGRLESNCFIELLSLDLPDISSQLDLGHAFFLAVLLKIILYCFVSGGT